MIADIPHSPDIIYQDIGYSDSFPTTSKRNNNSKINLTNRNYSYYQQNNYTFIHFTIMDIITVLWLSIHPTYLKKIA